MSRMNSQRMHIVVVQIMTEYSPVIVPVPTKDKKKKWNQSGFNQCSLTKWSLVFQLILEK